MAFASWGSGCPWPVVPCSFATPALFTRSWIPLGSASPTLLASASTSSRFVISAGILSPLQLSRYPPQVDQRTRRCAHKVRTAGRRYPVRPACAR